MAKLITGIFRTRSSSMLAVEDLIRHGFSQDDISLLMSETTRGREFLIDEHTKSPEGIATGATIGGILGAIALGLGAVGSVAAPGLGIYAAGHWLSMLAGFGAGALSGGVIGGLIGLGIPEHEAELYRGEIEKGGILLGLYVADNDRAAEGQRLMEASGGEHVRAENAREDAKAKQEKMR